jgi:hypothetical protein
MWHIQGDGEVHYKVLVGQPDGKRPLGRSMHMLEGNIKITFKEAICTQYKMWGISSLAMELLGCQDGLCSMELISYLFIIVQSADDNTLTKEKQTNMENCMYSTPYIIIVILNIRVHQ